MKPVDITSNIYIDFNHGNNKEGPKFKVDDHVRIPKYEKYFWSQIGLKKILWWKKLKILCHGHMLLVIITVKK